MSQRRRESWPLRILIYAWIPVLLIVAWFAVSAGSTNVFWPPLTTILGALADSFAEGTLWTDLAYSLTNYLAGILIALFLGLALGMAIGRVRIFRTALVPLLDFARSTPQVSFVPVVILALGIGALPKILLIAVACLWPILLNTIDGVSRLSASVNETVRAYGLPRRLRVLKVYLPGALPSITIGVRVAISVGVVMLIVSEMFGSSQGLGYFITQSGQSFNLPMTWAGTLLIGIIGYLLSVGYAAVERRMLWWYYQTTRAAGRRVKKMEIQP